MSNESRDGGPAFPAVTTDFRSRIRGCEKRGVAAEGGVMATVTQHDYRLRGKCREMAEAAVASDPTLTLVRGHYYCPYWGEQPHWWTTRQDGSVYDPTAAQFPSLGAGDYVPFDGMVACAECGKEMAERDVEYGDGRFIFCSSRCYGYFVGVA